jgi:phosphotransferase system enzyme I (PtsI)
MSAAIPITVLRGIPASRGVAAGPVFVVDERTRVGGTERKDYAEAVAALAARLEGIATALPPSRAEGAAILRAQAAMVRDPALASAVENLVAAGSGLPDAITKASATYAARLADVGDAYLRERSEDVREVGRLLVGEITGTATSHLAGLARPSIVVARRVSPADTLSVQPELVLGIVTEEGGITSHAAIVARELGIPAVVGVVNAVDLAGGHMAAEVDGASGEVSFMDHVNAHVVEISDATLDLRTSPVPLMANVGSLQAVLSAAHRGAQGVGLFRTEFLFMADDAPTIEDEQASIYAAACDAMSPHPVVVRTLDAGADKPLRYLPTVTERNPQLGRRGVRLWLGNEGLWRPQVRALLRASRDYKNLRVMLPMVAARSEMETARRLFDREAAAVGVPVPEIGMMVEVPAVAAALKAFEGVADFVSLGTNDLTQYTVAADRELDWDEDLSEFNPGVLRLIATVLADAKTMGIPAGVCGEMAGRPEGAIFLIGAGSTSLSMTVAAIPAVLAAIGRVGRAGCGRASDAALAALDGRSSSAALRRAFAQT